MKFLASVLVLVVFASTNGQRDVTYSTRKLFKTNLDCNYQTEMLCKVTLENNMYDNMVTTNLKDEVTYKISLCCNKMNMFDKKECLKMVRDDVSDVVTNYDTWTNDFNDDKYRSSSYYNDDNQFQSTKWFYDNNQYTENWFGRDDTEFDQDDFETGRTRWLSVPDMFRRCNQCNKCRRRLERTTDLVARKACRDNTMKDDRGAGETCCQAGRLVGSMVGRFHEHVCTAALYKFQTKVQGCNLNRKPECRRSFLFCCKQASDLAKKTEMMKEPMMTGGNIWL